MADEELREQVATTNRHYLELLKARTDYTLEMIMPEWADQILSLIKQNYVRLAKDQRLPDWKYYIWPETTQSKDEMARYQTGKINKEEHEKQRRQCFDEEFTIYKKGQQDMLAENFRRIEEDL